jgi:energy-coupling factor transporter ATP-binding protein EcfA2
MDNSDYANHIMSYAILLFGTLGALTTLWIKIRERQRTNHETTNEVVPKKKSLFSNNRTAKTGMPIDVLGAGLNRYIDQHPHALIIGPTGSGKTTFTRALLAQRAGRIAVLTPKPDPDDWPGVPITTIDNNGKFTELTRAFVQLGDDIRIRLVAAKRGQKPDEADTLTIVCDDWPVLASECGKPATDLFKLVARLGRSLRVRLVILSQSERVKSLGLEGEGDAKDNFVKITLQPDHSAVIDRIISATDFPINTSAAREIAALPQPTNRWWTLATSTNTDQARAILSKLFSEQERIPVSQVEAENTVQKAVSAIPVSPGIGGIAHQEAIPPAVAEEAPTNGIPATLTPEAIRTLYGAGWSKNKIAALLSGAKQRRLATIDAALIEEEVIA